ncbi:MAG: GNAT family N-acetyltransferase [Lapillicoccus sp.]
MPEDRYAVRPMRGEDAAAAGEVHVRVWRETYAADLPAVFLAALDPAVSAERIRMRVEVDDPETRVLVAVDEEGEVVGMATAGVTRDKDAPTAWELYSINTIGEVHGSGLADRLLAAAVGSRPVSLWVLETNARAQAFYRRQGFVADGSTKVHEASGRPEVRMVRGPRGDT